MGMKYGQVQVEGGMLKLMAAPVVGTGGYFLMAPCRSSLDLVLKGSLKP